MITITITQKNACNRLRLRLLLKVIMITIMITKLIIAKGNTRITYTNLSSNASKKINISQTCVKHWCSLSYQDMQYL